MRYKSHEHDAGEKKLAQIKLTPGGPPPPPLKIFKMNGTRIEPGTFQTHVVSLKGTPAYNFAWRVIFYVRWFRLGYFIKVSPLPFESCEGHFENV